jgi:hypothetical protein
MTLEELKIVGGDSAPGLLIYDHANLIDADRRSCDTMSESVWGEQEMANVFLQPGNVLQLPNGIRIGDVTVDTTTGLAQVGVVVGTPSSCKAYFPVISSSLTGAWKYCSTNPNGGYPMGNTCYG